MGITRQKISKKMEISTKTINQLKLTNIYKAFFQTAAEHKFFFSTYGTRIYNMLDFKQVSVKFLKIKITQSIFCEHNRYNQKSFTKVNFEN